MEARIHDFFPGVVHTHKAIELQVAQIPGDICQTFPLVKYDKSYNCRNYASSIGISDMA